MNSNFSEVVYNSSNDLFKLSIIIPYYNISELTEELNITLDNIKANSSKTNLIFVFNPDEYSIDIENSLKNKFDNLKILKLKSSTNLLSKYYNEGIKSVNTSYMYFSWAGAFIDKKIFNFANNNNFSENVLVSRSKTLNKVKKEIDFSVYYGWLQSTPLYELNNIIVSNSTVQTIGLFDTSEILQKYFYWEWILRLARSFSFYNLGASLDDSLINLESYPIKNKLNIEYDLVHRYVLRIRKLPFLEKYVSNTEKEFFSDLKNNNLCPLSPNNSEKSLKLINNDLPLKICIIGGYWEYHHIQITFLNYLDKLYGKGIVTYKIGLDSIIEINDIKNSDLVIICRSRNNRILNIIDYCNSNKIPTLYMIDDNWLTVAKDIPDIYGNWFIPGNIEFDTFLESLKKCTAVITYNKYLYNSILEFNKNCILFPLNIDLNYYKKILSNKSSIRIAYSGSLRHTSVAFEALKNSCISNSNIEVFYFGKISREQKQLLSSINIKFINFSTYPLYCETIALSDIDILLAPLNNDLYSKSKCPNKYLEAGAINSAGIYSDVYPYNSVVTDKVNGILVKENTVNAWQEAINLLCNNTSLLSCIKKNCRNDVEINYKTENHIQEFIDLLKNLKIYLLKE